MDKRLPQILSTGVFGYVQLKAWMDNLAMRIWHDSVLKPYITQHDGEAGLLLDDFIFHKSDALKMHRGMTIRICTLLFPPPYAGLLQSCNVGSPATVEG